jgi:hypothetical protein
MTGFSLTRRHALLGTAGVLAGSAVLSGRSEAKPATADGPWAIELFTSQGCSSCPPADKALGRLAQRADIVALSFHVNYWDYIGWKDPFASADATERQRDYARVLRQRYVYTPEMVFDGVAHGAGTRTGEVDEMIDRMRGRHALRATPQLMRAADGSLSIKLDAQAIGRPAEITLAVYDRHHSTKVPRGENTGNTLDNFNVVRRLEKVASWNGQEATFSVAAARFGPQQGIAVLVQGADLGPILGCNKLETNTAG